MAVRDTGQPWPVSAPMAAPNAQSPPPRKGPPRNDGPALPSRSGGDSQDDTPSQSAQPRPPTDIPTKPISFIRRPRPDEGIALTIDDGPHPVWTPQVLDLLGQYHVHATFCLIGEQVREYPELVRRIVEEGHTLCDHTWDHDERLPQRTPHAVLQEIQDTYDAILQVTGGVKPVYFRAPGGNWSPQVVEDARALGMISLNWSVDPVDWSRPGSDKIVTVVLDNTVPGDVILMHDGGGDRSQSLAALRSILPTLQGRGYSFITP